ncbi:MAG: glycosyltransferase family 1 protein [Flavobacterium sp.]|nr:MAG: glycosyltransferase family 1 protein [Flavobacterium sp.]
MRGLDKLKIPYRLNDFAYAQKHPNELVGIIGKTQVLNDHKIENPILLGASIHSHPLEYPNLISENKNIHQILVPGVWMKKMFEEYYGNIVEAWPVGIDCEKWNPSIKKETQFDFLIYDKIRWERKSNEEQLITPLKSQLKNNGLTYTEVTYNHYTHQELLDKVAISKGVIFLAKHETQGLAYQQILATGTPILAYDQQEFWLDPEFYPHRVKYGPVSSVPYWDDRCGIKFKSIGDFDDSLKQFLDKYTNRKFNPRAYITENLTLEKCAKAYFSIYTNLEKKIEKLNISKLK